tara:strand:- start:519 stop:1106 length:588 start_codon:yes stop_codon:yes gene_type:complete
MGLKNIRSEILKDDDSKYALDFAIQVKREQDPMISRESIVDEVVLPIAYHESQLDPKAIQKTMRHGVEVNGAGRGLMQFEPASLYTAAKRAQIILTKNKEKVPAYINRIVDNKMLDASKLTTGQQTALALFDLLQKPEANIALVTTGSQNVKNLWENYWWAGKKNKPLRRKKFSEDYKLYLLDYRDNIKGKANGR